MIIDIHTHTFPDRIAVKAIQKLQSCSHTVPVSDGTADGLLETMKKSGVDLSVVLPVATAPKQVTSINNSAAEVNEKGMGLFSIGAMHPDYEDWYSELGRIKALGLKGIKLHPVYQGVDLDDLRYLRIMNRCAELGLFVIAHMGLDIGYPGVYKCTPEMAYSAVREIGAFDFVLAHMGGWRSWDTVLELLPETGVKLDTAFSTGHFPAADDGYWTEEDTQLMQREEFMKFVEAFGTDRILFGTDSPWHDSREDLEFIRSLPLSKEQIDQILGENAARLLGL